MPGIRRLEHGDPGCCSGRDDRARPPVDERSAQCSGGMARAHFRNCGFTRPVTSLRGLPRGRDPGSLRILEASMPALRSARRSKRGWRSSLPCRSRLPQPAPKCDGSGRAIQLCRSQATVALRRTVQRIPPQFTRSFPRNVSSDFRRSEYLHWAPALLELPCTRSLFGRTARTWDRPTPSLA